MKTQTEIDAQIKALKEIRPKVRPFSMFGDSNLDQLDVQVRVLEENMRAEIISDKFEFANENVQSAAWDARAWIDGEYDDGDLDEGWPLIK